MTDGPILFSAPMVRALLADRKTHTRRAVFGQKISAKPSSKGPTAKMDALNWLHAGMTPEYVADPANHLSPYGYPGDRLWVRETWGDKAADPPGCLGGRRPERGDPINFRADPGQAAQWGSGLPSQGGFVWRPSIHMPRWASRITLEITEVRIERLNAISEADAIAEGVCEFPCEGPHRGEGATYWSAAEPDSPLPIKRTTPVDAYRALWEDINGELSWADNPWVWVVVFKRVATPTITS